jgi:hypothetical protein
MRSSDHPPKAPPRPDGTLTTEQVREYLNLGSANAARIQMCRWEIDAVGRDTATGQKLWPAQEVEDRNAARPRPRQRPSATSGR